MKPENTEELLDLMNGSIPAAAVGAAMELGLFWLLAVKPLPVDEVARSLNIPLSRCQHWLQILGSLGLLEETPAGYAPSTVARQAVLSALSRDAWAFQAREYRDSAWFVRDLALNLGRPLSAWPGRDAPPPDYFQQVQADPGFAGRFTRKLYEIHLPLAGQLAGLLDLRGARSLLDLGGGSGVVSFALLRKQPDLASVVVDVDNVCRAGRELAVENGLEERVVYLAADILQDDLPAGFDLALLCDVGAFSESLFRRIYAALNPQGRLVIVDKFAPRRDSPPPSRLPAALLDALKDPAGSIDFTTVQVVQALLQQSGFRDLSATPVPPKDHLPWNIDWAMLQARKPTDD